jgi:hypothetical protein
LFVLQPQVLGLVQLLVILHPQVLGLAQVVLAALQLESLIEQLESKSGSKFKSASESRCDLSWVLCTGTEITGVQGLEDFEV